MNVPGVPSDFQFPEDPGDMMAWLKNFAEKLPQYAEKLEIPAETLADVQRSYEEMRAAKEAEDKARLKLVEANLCAVPDGWPPPATLLDLMRQIPAIEEPQRTRMLEEIERWSAAIVRAGSPRPTPKLSGGYFEEGIMVRVELPEPCKWARFYYRKAGDAAWIWLAICRRDYYLFTDPETQEDEVWEGDLEFVVLGLLEHENPQIGFSEAWGSPSEVLRWPVPTEYPVPAALIAQYDKGQTRGSGERG